MKLAEIPSSRYLGAGMLSIRKVARFSQLAKRRGADFPLVKPDVDKFRRYRE
jgi:hypothetical protein